MLKSLTLLVLGLTLAGAGCRDAAAEPEASEAEAAERSTPIKNIVLVHGAFVDGGGWEAVYRRLKHDGYRVSVVQDGLTSLADDVATTRRVLDLQDGPTILVGHSYGGAVISESGNHAKVAGLVYVAAFALDSGESVQTLLENSPPGAPVPPILPPVDGFLLLDRAKFHAAFAADLSAERAAFLADAQVPWAVAALAGTVGQTAWRSKPSWYLVTTEDRMIAPDAQRFMARRAMATTVEVKGSHAIYESKPADVAALIEQAARLRR